MHHPLHDSSYPARFTSLVPPICARNIIVNRPHLMTSKLYGKQTLCQKVLQKRQEKMLPIGDQKRSSLRVSEVRGHQQLVHQVSYYSLILRISKLSWSWSCVYSVFVFPLELSIFLISAAPFKWASSSERTQPAVVRSSAH